MSRIIGASGMEALTVQDHPFHIANDSLVWQEYLGGPIRSFGSEGGFETNLAQYLQGKDRKGA